MLTCTCAAQPEAALDPQDAQVLESFRQHTPASRDLPLPPEARRKSRYILEAPSTPFLKPGQVRAAVSNTVATAQAQERACPCR